MQSFTHITQDDSHSSPPYIRIDKVNKFYQGQAQAIHALKDISLGANRQNSGYYR